MLVYACSALYAESWLSSTIVGDNKGSTTYDKGAGLFPAPQIIRSSNQQISRLFSIRALRLPPAAPCPGTCGTRRRNSPAPGPWRCPPDQSDGQAVVRRPRCCRWLSYSQHRCLPAARWDRPHDRAHQHDDDIGARARNAPFSLPLHVQSRRFRQAAEHNEQV